MFQKLRQTFSRKKNKQKFLLIGWDAADWKVINPLIAEGHMPHLQRMMANGVHGNIATLTPPLSPMLWTSVATGKTADKHGILGFTQPSEDGTRVQPVLGTSRQTKTIWNILNQEGMKTNVIGWWPSHPAEPVNGVSVTNFYHKATDPKGIKPWPLAPQSVYPERLEATMAELRVHPTELTGAHLLPFVPRAREIDQSQPNRLYGVAKTIADASSVHAAATWAMENEPWDFMAVYYDAIDHFGHGFMKFHPPKRDHIPQDQYDLYNYVVRAGYRFHDMMLGRLLELAGPDTTVLLISDHGFHSDHLRLKSIPKFTAGPAYEHRDHGIFCMVGPQVNQGQKVYAASLLDITPTILMHYGLPLGRDMDGKPLVTAFRDYPDPTYISSWDEVPADQTYTYDPETQHDPWGDYAVMKQLEELGYIDHVEGENQNDRTARLVAESEYWLAQVYKSKNDDENAMRILDKLYQQNPHEARYGVELLDMHRSKRNFVEARRLLELIRTRGNHDLVRLDLVEALILLGEDKIDEALAHLNQLIREDLDQRTADFHFYIGRAYIAIPDYDQAEKAFLQALEIDPHHVSSHHGLVRVYMAKQRFEDVIYYAIEGIDLRYKFPALHFYLGEAFRQIGDYQHAAEAYEVAVYQAPTMKKAYNRLIHLCETYLQRPDDAAIYRQLLEQIDTDLTEHETVMDHQ